ncbi:MAG: flavodoxin family protein [Candidatus Wallbacteria bacterium]|nr:flavodoxin family protein [Candidatus Wallbacteria bacterium]
MRILGIVGSMRRDKYTNLLVNQVISEIREIEPSTFEIIQVSDLDVSPCRVVCSSFCAGHPYECSIKDDVAGVLQKIELADALVIGAPLYFRGPPTKFQALIERIIALFFSLESAGTRGIEAGFKNKPCGLVGVAEYTNPLQVLEYLHDFANLLGMKTVKVPRLPYLGVGGQGDVRSDKIFNPFERSKELAEALVREFKTSQTAPESEL